MEDPIDPLSFEAHDSGFTRVMAAMSAGYSGDQTLLESGQVLRHHSAQDCQPPCCLHGSSPYTRCRSARIWRGEKSKRYIEHVCPCGDIGHPCLASLVHTSADTAHGCCGIEGHCTLDEAPVSDDPENSDPGVVWVSQVNKALTGVGNWMAAHRVTHDKEHQLWALRERRLEEEMERLRHNVAVTLACGALGILGACGLLVILFS